MSALLSPRDTLSEFCFRSFFRKITQKISKETIIKNTILITRGSTIKWIEKSRGDWKIEQRLTFSGVVCSRYQRVCLITFIKKWDKQISVHKNMNPISVPQNTYTCQIQQKVMRAFSRLHYGFCYCHNVIISSQAPQKISIMYENWRRFYCC